MILFDIYIYSDCDSLLFLGDSKKEIIEDLEQDNMILDKDYYFIHSLDLKLPKYKKNLYQDIKETLRQNAIEYSNYFSGCNMSYFTLLKLQNYFTRYGKKYGLLTEFKQNGII